MPNPYLILTLILKPSLNPQRAHRICEEQPKLDLIAIDRHARTHKESTTIQQLVGKISLWQWVVDRNRTRLTAPERERQNKNEEIQSVSMGVCAHV